MLYIGYERRQGLLSWFEPAWLDVGGEWYRNPALGVRLECWYWTWRNCSETWIDKETKPKWCGSKSPPGQGEKLEFRVLLFEYTECDGDRDDFGGSTGFSRAKSWNSSLLCSQTPPISYFLSLTLTHFPEVHRKTHSACTDVDTPVHIVLRLWSINVVLALAMSMVTVDYRTTKWVRLGNRVSISAQTYFALLTVLMDPKHKYSHCSLTLTVRWKADV